MRRREGLPTKICRVCGRPFAWRKKWERDWPRINCCSERCRRGRKAGTMEKAS
ncbi:MAG: DUF2256 domain-containing protein [Planctomycetia bacterium]|nr:DUF2256 domain-containing protein [Planctomycetia bacterium]